MLTDKLERSHTDALRIPFDRSFAEAPASLVRDDVAMVTLAFDTNRLFALAVSDLAGVYRGLEIVPLIGAPADLLGIVGVRGETIVVYSLASLLQIDAEPAAGPWIAVSAANRSVGFTFSDFRGYVAVPRKDVVAAPQGAPSFVRNVVRVDGGTISVIDVSRLLAEHASVSAVRKR